MIGNSRFSLGLRDGSFDGLDLGRTKAGSCSLELWSRHNRSLKIRQGGTRGWPAFSCRECGKRGSSLNGWRSFGCSHGGECLLGRILNGVCSSGYEGLRDGQRQTSSRSTES